MRNANKPAMPQERELWVEGIGLCPTEATGLTKREMFAMHAMSTVLSKYDPWESGHFDSSNWQETAENCVGLADALLAELEK